MKFRLDYQMITAVSALFISVVALVVSVSELRVMRVEQHASNWPYLTVDVSYSGQGFELFVRNSGTGLALIHSITRRYNGEVFDRWEPVIDDIMGEPHDITYSIYRTSNFTRKILPEGQQATQFAVPWNDETRQLVKSADSIEVEVCYCSVLETCWRVSQTSRKQVQQCSNYDFGFSTGE